MKSKLLKAMAIAGGLGSIVGGTGAATVNMRYDRTFDVPEVDVGASTDSVD